MLKARLIITWFLLAVIALAGSYLILNSSLGETEEKLLVELTDKSIQLARQEMEIRGRVWLEQLQAVAKTAPISKMLNGNLQDKESLDRLHTKVLPLGEQIVLKLSCDLFWLVDQRGRIVMRHPRRKIYGDGVRGLPMVESLLEGLSSEGVLMIDNKLMHTVGAPLVDRSRGVVVGGLVAAYNLDKAWLEKLGSSNNANFATFFKGKLLVSSLWPELDATLNEAMKALPFERDWQAGKNTAFEFSKDDRRFLGRAILFSGPLAAFKSGVIAILELPPGWRSPQNDAVRYLIIGSLGLFLFGVVLSILVSRWLRKRASREAQTIMEMKRTGTLLAKLDEEKFFVEFEPYVELLNQFISDISPRQRKTTIENVAHWNADENGAVAPPPGVNVPDSDSEPTEAAGEALYGSRKLTPTSMQKLTEREKRALDRVATDSMINDLESLISTGSSPTIPEETNEQLATPKPPMKVQAEKVVKKKPSRKLPPIPDDENIYLKQVFDTFMKTREMLGQPTNNINQDKFIANLQNNRSRIKTTTGCAKVRFTVFEKDGKASVKAAPDEA